MRRSIVNFAVLPLLLNANQGCRITASSEVILALRPRRIDRAGIPVIAGRIGLLPSKAVVAIIRHIWTSGRGGARPRDRGNSCPRGRKGYSICMVGGCKLAPAGGDLREIYVRRDIGQDTPGE